MIDLKVNENHDIVLDPSTNDLATVEGWEHDQQRLATETIALFYEEIGDATDENVLERVEVLAKRVASNIDGIDGVLGFEAVFDDTDPNLVKVRTHYASGESYEFPLRNSESNDG